MTETQLQLNADEDFDFASPDVAAKFDAHVREQLPWYDLVTYGIAHIARHYLAHGGLVYDIGAATGNVGRILMPTLQVRGAEFIPIDSSPEMEKVYNGPGTLRIRDAALSHFDPFDVAISNLTLVFMSIPARTRLIARLKENCKPGGCIIIVEKVQGGGGYIDDVLYKLTLSNKLKAGAKPKEIISKELCLSGIQRPLEISEVKDFRPWFVFGNFAGMIYEG